MAREYVDRITVTVNGVDLDDIILEMTEERSRATKPVNTLNKARKAKGFKRGNLMYKLSMKCEQIDDPLLPDWDTIMANGTLIQVAKVPRVGLAVQFFDVTVTDVNDSNTDGDSTRQVSCLALRRKVG